MAKLEPQLCADLNKATARPFGASLSNPYGILGTPVVNITGDFTVPSGKVLVVTNAPYQLRVSGKGLSVGSGNISFFPSGTVVQYSQGSDYGWTGLIFQSLEGITPIVNITGDFTVPSGKVLVVTNAPYQLRVLKGPFQLVKDMNQFSQVEPLFNTPKEAITAGLVISSTQQSSKLIQNNSDFP